MATSRIRYKKTSIDGVVQSIKEVISESRGSKYRVILDLNKCTYVILNVNSGRKFDGGEGVNNTHVLKRHVKRHLETLGVSFGKEVRDNSGRKVGVNCSYK